MSCLNTLAFSNNSPPHSGVYSTRWLRHLASNINIHMQRHGPSSHLKLHGYLGTWEMEGEWRPTTHPDSSPGEEAVMCTVGDIRAGQLSHRAQGYSIMAGRGRNDINIQSQVRK